MTRAMLCENEIPKFLWAEAVNTACYILNRTIIRKGLKKTPYELWKEPLQILSTFMFLDANALYLTIKKTLENLIQNPMKECL